MKLNEIIQTKRCNFVALQKFVLYQYYLSLSLPFYFKATEAPTYCTSYKATLFFFTRVDLLDGTRRTGREGGNESRSDVITRCSPRVKFRILLPLHVSTAQCSAAQCAAVAAFFFPLFALRCASRSVAPVTFFITDQPGSFDNPRPPERN